MNDGACIRLQKFLSQAGVASRRKAEDLIRAGRVAIEGHTVTELGTRVRPSRDTVTVDGRIVRPATLLWIALNKPPGYVSTRHDPRGRPTVYDLLAPRLRRLFHVGRLDFDSEGLLLLTNDGDAAHRLLHPSHGVRRVYEVDVAGLVGQDECKRLLDGIHLEDGSARALAVEVLGAASANTGRLRLTLAEGRKREVRRMLDAVGHPVLRLVRVGYGPIRLGALPRSAYRRLTPAEIRRIGAAAPGP